MLFWNCVGAAHLAVFVHKCLYLEVLRMHMRLYIGKMYSLRFLFLLYCPMLQAWIGIFKPVPPNTNILTKYCMIKI